MSGKIKKWLKEEKGNEMVKGQTPGSSRTYLINHEWIGRKNENQNVKR